MSFINVHSHRPGANTVFNLIVGQDNVPTEGLFSAGIHPWHIGHIETLLEELANTARNPRCVAIGECKLNKLCDTPFAWQLVVFKNQVEMALQLKKPLIIHCVKAFDELLKIKQEMGGDIPWIVHGFNQKEEIGKRLLQQGFYFSLGVALLKTDSNASILLPNIPLERLFLETDDKDIRIEAVYSALALRSGLIESELVANLQANFERVFQTSI